MGEKYIGFDMHKTAASRFVHAKKIINVEFMGFPSKCWVTLKDNAVYQLYNINAL